LTTSKKQRKIVIGFGQGAFVIPATFAGEQMSFQSSVRERVQFANDCIRERETSAREQQKARRKRRDRR